MKRLFFLIFAIIVFASLLCVDSFAYKDSTEYDIQIVFTHDLHSHIDPFMLDGESVGGFARIKTYLNNVSDDNTIVVDAGDFSMGTLYQSIFSTHASEYSLMSSLGYDAISFGNHEFDYGFDAIEKMINAAKSNSSSLPPILCSNIDKKKSGFSDSYFLSLNVRPYTIIQKGSKTIAVFGLLGPDAVLLSESDDVYFSDYIESAKSVVSEIENLHSPDLIICLSHSGTGESVDDADVELAKEIPQIDVIISGHTHTMLDEPIIVGDTIIASCGEYGSNAGNLKINISDQKCELVKYEIVKIDSSIPEDEEFNLLIDKYTSYTTEYLSKFGFEAPDQIISYSNFDFPENDLMSGNLADQQLGNLISDAYKYSIEASEGDKYIPIDVSVAPLGVIRGSIDKGNITVSQIYDISSLGIGPDGLSGYPLCSVYLYGYELWDVAEIDASVSSLMSYTQLYCSGLQYSINTNRMFLDRVYDCWLVDENGNRIEIENDKLYRVVSGIYSARMLSTVKDKSFGLLSIEPKDASGNVINVFEDHIIVSSDGYELKEWKALADYLASFPVNESGIPTIPDTYLKPAGRKVVYDTFSLSQLFVNWSLITWLVVGIILVLIALTILIVVIIIKKQKKKKRAAIADSEEIE